MQDNVITHSRLTEVNNQLSGRSFTSASDNLELTNQFKEALYHPIQYKLTMSHKEEWWKNRFIVEQMVASIQSNSLYKLLKEKAIVQKNVEWLEDRYGLECGGRIDMRSGTTVSDIRITAAKDLHDFASRISAHDYDRKAAFFIDGLNAKRFVFFGVQKKSPFKTFTIAFNWDDPVIAAGREKYESLIDEYLTLRSEEKI